MSSGSSTASSVTFPPMTNEALVDALVAAALDSDVVQTVKILQEMDTRGLTELVNGQHSGSGVTPLVAAGMQDASHRASLVLRLLALGGAVFPPTSASSDWLSSVQPWAFETLEDPTRAKEGEDELRALLGRDAEGVARWLRGTLFSPTSPPPHRLEAMREVGPIKRVKFEDEVEVVDLPSLGYLDLTNEPDSRSPSPKAEDDDGAVSPPRARDKPLAQAHVTVNGFPETFGLKGICEIFAGLPGIVSTDIAVTTSGVRFGFIGFASVAAASHAYAKVDGTSIFGTTDYGETVCPLTFRLFGLNGPKPNPYVQSIEPAPFRYLTAAELRRRLYFGNLDIQVSEGDILTILNNRAGVTGRIKRIGRTKDHTWVIVQVADSKVAQKALRIHGQVYNGHLLQVEPVNELLHRWRFSLVLVGLPTSWTYHDVCDFLIATIRSFPSLAMLGAHYSSDHSRMLRTVVVELRYEKELQSARGQLDGRIVEDVQICATIAPPGRLLKRPRDADGVAEGTGRKRARAPGEGHDDVRMASAPPAPAPARVPPVPLSTTSYRDRGAPLGAYTLSSTPSLSGDDESVATSVSAWGSPLHAGMGSAAADPLFTPFDSALGLSN
ncbi:hypothetical protein JCM3770_003069 [Rhodotorula araucariae]